AYSDQTLARADFQFYGTGLRYRVGMGPVAGKASVWVDGMYLTTLDLYSPTYRLQTLAREGLPRALRTVSIVVTRTKNPNSSGYYVDIDAFEVVP
ncbi:MAG: hypothetical protein GTN78_20535, partial [Gemmatimonadales bacterium]|nr:hypothetical protein [Gemmatimonadales bacterium]